MLTGFFILLFIFILFAIFILNTYTETVPNVQFMAEHHLLLEKDHPDGLLEDEEHHLLRLQSLPTSVNLWTRQGSSKIPVDDQGQFGSCTAHAMRYAWNLYRMKQNPNAVLTLPSRTFWYAESRMRLGDRNFSKDNGSTISATVWALVNKGSITETLYPYTAQNINRAPPSSIETQALSNRLSLPFQIRYSSATANTLSSLKTALSNGQSIQIGILVYASFMTPGVMRTGVIPMPRARESLLGGHAICLTGYNDSTQMFSFRNSWGTSVGINGLFQIPYAYISNPAYSGDAWAF